ncbi:MAG TPA: peptidylprolyl isomerase [Pirellulaceae bacterium]|nr:peptidylprolyl isomerase [Pirellulaceae bacterium]
MRVLLPLALLALLAVATAPLLAQKPDEPKPAETPAPPAAEPLSPAQQFQAAHREWTALDKRLTELQQMYAKETAAAARAEIKKQYQELVDQSELLLPKLQAAAIAAYEAEPNKDAEVTRTLIGLVAYAYRSDDYETALKLARLMEAQNCDEAVLYGLAGAAAFQSDDYETAEAYLTRADKAGKLDTEGKELLAALPQQKKAWAKEQEIRKAEATADDLPRVKLETSKGPIVIELFENEAPQAVGNFVSLVESKFYDGLTFHRVLPGFMAQGGDPTGDGTGGPGYEIYCECYKENARQHFRGTLSMAHAGRDTGGSQFFLTFGPTTHLNGKHTAFGRVIEGLDVLAKLQRRDPTRANPPPPDKIVKAEVLRKRDHKYEPTKVK